MWKLNIYVKDCFKMLVADRQTSEMYKLKYKKGVMFTAIGIDKEIPVGPYTDQSVANKLAALDEKMSYMEMMGLFNVQMDFIGQGADQTQVFYRVLFIPILYKKLWWITILHILSYLIIGYFLFVKFGLWEYIQKLF